MTIISLVLDKTKVFKIAFDKMSSHFCDYGDSYFACYFCHELKFRLKLEL
jgi:hypothetical protein